MPLPTLTIRSDDSASSSHRATKANDQPVERVVRSRAAERAPLVQQGVPAVLGTGLRLVSERQGKHRLI